MTEQTSRSDIHPDSETIARVVAMIGPVQRKALIAAVDALDELAGEGFCVAEDAIFELFEAFDGDPELNYPEWIRTLLADGGQP